MRFRKQITESTILSVQAENMSDQYHSHTGKCTVSQLSSVMVAFPSLLVLESNAFSDKHNLIDYTGRVLQLHHLSVKLSNQEVRCH